MVPEKLDGMLNFTYVKPTAEILPKVTAKATALRAKVEEREARIRRIRSEYKITDGVLIDLLNKARASKAGVALSYTYSTGPRDEDEVGASAEDHEVMIGAGVINGLLTESDYVEAERAAADKLDMIARNLRDLGEDGKLHGHHLGHRELVYLGF